MPDAPVCSTAALPADWRPWRAPSSIGDRRPTKAEMAQAVTARAISQDVLPYSTDDASAGHVRLLIVGINPSPWTALVNAPFARPGNRFWPSLAAGGLLERTVDASRGLSTEDERMLAERGIGIVSFVDRPTARADELSRDELREGGRRLVERVRTIRPDAVAVVGITAFRTALRRPRAQMGRQDTADVDGWPEESTLWVLPNPSGLNAHETIASLGERWAQAFPP